MGKCPKCDKILTFVNLSGLDVHTPNGGALKGVTYECPMCQSVLSVQIDPIAVKTDIVNAIGKLRRG